MFEFGFNNYWEVPAQGQSGGIVLLCHANFVSVTRQSQSEQELHAMIQVLSGLLHRNKDKLRLFDIWNGHSWEWEKISFDVPSDIIHRAAAICPSNTLANQDKPYWAINPNGLYLSLQHFGGIGRVIRDADGQWIVGFSNKSMGNSGTMVELEALHQGLCMASSFACTPLEIESDCTDLIQLLQHPISPYTNIVSSCRLMLRNLGNLVVRHNFRLDNTVADSLAKAGSHLLHIQAQPFLVSPPPTVKVLLQHDRDGASTSILVSWPVCHHLVSLGNQSVISNSSVNNSKALAPISSHVSSAILLRNAPAIPATTTFSLGFLSSIKASDSVTLTDLSAVAEHSEMYTSRQKIHKDKDAEPSEFEESVAQALFDLENTNQELKSELKDLYINSAAQIDVSGNRKAVVIHVPYRLRKAFRKVHVRLVRELEKKFSGKDVIFIATRRIVRPPKRGSAAQRPRSRTLTSVHDAILEDLVVPAEIVGKRTRYRVDGSKIMKVYLDPKERNNTEYKLETFSAVYRKLSGKDVVFEFPHIEA
ncbi:hypothetical protein CQW23_11362 [Capsicum baccatum]|nr:hypothetical protein CQW23_11362 [Capsicum baccatum]